MRFVIESHEPLTQSVYHMRLSGEAVYKRQVLYTGLVLTGRVPLATVLRAMTDAPRAVSYTHLDVYKRQGLQPPAAGKRRSGSARRWSGGSRGGSGPPCA